MLCGWVVSITPAVANVVEERKRPFAFSVLFAVAVATGSLGGFVGGNMPGWCQSLGARLAGVAVSAIDAKKMTLFAACVITALAAWPVRRLGGGARSESVRWTQRPSPFLVRFLLASACWAAAVGAFNPFTNCLLCAIPESSGRPPGRLLLDCTASTGRGGSVDAIHSAPNRLDLRNHDRPTDGCCCRGIVSYRSWRIA